VNRLKIPKFIISSIVIGLLFTSIQPVYAATREDIFRNFTMAVFKKDDKKVRSYLSSSVEIPEIRENTPITGIQGLSSPEKEKMVFVGRFQQEGEIQRIAFIWEVTFGKEKIEQIRVVADGSNPYMNEKIATRDYKKRYQKEVLVPSHFPFEVTHVESRIFDKKLTLTYKNCDTNDAIQIMAFPKTEELNQLVKKDERKKTLNNGREVFFREGSSSYDIIFLDNNLQYVVTINKKGKRYKADILKFVESMIHI
jgi:hypothetical protein